MYRKRGERLEVLLVHPGGPFWNKDLGAWSIPKGEAAEGEDLLSVAKREFQEELGWPPAGEFVSLGSIRQKGGKTVHAWCFEGDCDPAAIQSNTFTIEWPPKSGKKAQFPEVDRAQWVDLLGARQKINLAQKELLDRAEKLLLISD